MLTLQEFRDTMEIVPVEAARARLGIDPSPGTKSVLFYSGMTFIETESDEHCFLRIAHDCWVGPRATLEAVLYFEWYVSECAVGEHTTENMVALFMEWCDYAGTAPQCATEILADFTTLPPEARDQATQKKASWLAWFTRTVDGLSV